MAKNKRSSHSRHAPTSRNAPGSSACFPECLYEGVEEAARLGDWERWLGSALETGDPQFWPKIRQLYQEHPDWRWTILFHLPIYWREHQQMVAPVFREALRDPQQCAEAFKAVATFPSLAEEAIAALQDPLLDGLRDELKRRCGLDLDSLIARPPGAPAVNDRAVLGQGP